MISTVRRVVEWQVLLLAAATVAGCSQSRTPPVAPLTSAPLEMDNTYVFRCADDYRFSVQVTRESALVQYGRETHTLSRVASDSTMQFSDSEITFASRGLEGSLETPRSSYDGCVGRLAATPWERAGMLGYDFRAVGQEPGWLVEIDAEDHMLVTLDYGERKIYTDSPDPVFDLDDVTIYRTRADSVDLIVVIAERNCEDTMSGEEYPTSVELRLGDQTYQGCGGFLDDDFGPRLDNRIWTLTELGGRRVEALVQGLSTYLQFDVESMRVAGYTGCNNIVGIIVLFGDDLRFREPLAMTRMGCPEAIAAGRERSFLEAMRRTTRFTVAEEVLTLYSGNVAVARFRGDRN